MEVEPLETVAKGDGEDRPVSCLLYDCVKDGM